MNRNATMKPATSIGATKFREQCLSLMDELEPEGLVITKHGRPVARLIPYQMRPEEMIGCLDGKLEIYGDILSTGVPWNANERSDS